MSILKQFLPTSIGVSKETIFTGNGIINSLIDSLPFQLHLPGGYKYAGPGTHLRLNLEKNIKPKNKLDEAAMYHDIVYDESKDTLERRKADKILENKAWDRVKAKDSLIGEKINAWAVTNAMKAKRFLGQGINISKNIRKSVNKKKKTKKTLNTSCCVNMPNIMRKTKSVVVKGGGGVSGNGKSKRSGVNSSTVYVKQRLNLNENDKQRLIEAVRLKKPIEITVQYKRTKDSIINEILMPLTKIQIRKLNEGKIKKKNVKLKLLKKQLTYFEKNGEGLPLILAAAPVIASIASTLYKAYNDKKTNDRLIEERKRHNKTLESKITGSGLRKCKNKTKVVKGKGVYVNKKIKGQGIKKKIKKKTVNTGLKCNKKGKGVYINKKIKGQGVNKKIKIKGNGLLELFKKKKLLR